MAISLVPFDLIILGSFIINAVFYCRYNKVAQIWEERGSSEFSNNVFYLVDSVSQRILLETDCSSGVDYPVRDRCNLMRDPPEGCILTNATYYYGESYVQSNENWISIVSAQNTTIFNTAYQKNITYILDRDDLGCSHNPYMYSSLIILVSFAIVIVTQNMVNGITERNFAA